MMIARAAIGESRKRTRRNAYLGSCVTTDVLARIESGVEKVGLARPFCLRGPAAIRRSPFSYGLCCQRCDDAGPGTDALVEGFQFVFLEIGSASCRERVCKYV